MQNEKKDLREVLDSLRMVRVIQDMRHKRTGDNLTAGEIARLGIELLYSGELEMDRLRKERFVFDVEEIPQKL